MSFGATAKSIASKAGGQLRSSVMTKNEIRGALNMLRNCAEIRSGDQILIVHEDSGQDYYDRESITAVLEAARNIGAEVEVLEIPVRAKVGPVPAPLRRAMDRTDHTVFMARIGDQLRFGRVLGKQATVCYALDAHMLGSPFGTVDHRAMLALKDAVNSALNAAEMIRVTCPAGTDFAGPGSTILPDDVGIRRFPMSVCTPVSAAAFSGVVALPGFLVGTGSHYYEPYGISYEGRLSAWFDRGKLSGFEGDPAAIKLAEAHYDRVATLFNLDRDCVHSWHVGIHPGCAFPYPARHNFRRWSGSAFGNPRLLHFHTCGAYPPGEISWNVLDPTVELDGTAIWEHGVLHPDRLAGGSAILERHPLLRAAFANSAKAVGLE